MGRRRDANRAEAIVKGIGAIVLLLLLWVVTQLLPGMLKGKSPEEMRRTLIGLIAVFTFLAIATGVIGLVVWLKVRNRK